MGFLAFAALVTAIVAAVRAGAATRASVELTREVKGLRNQMLLERHHRNEDRKRADARIEALNADLAALRPRGLPAPDPAEDAAPQDAPTTEAEDAPESEDAPTQEGSVELPEPPTEDATLTVREEIRPERRGVDGPPVHHDPEDTEDSEEADEAPPAPLGTADPPPAVEPPPAEPPPTPPAPPPATPGPRLEEWLGIRGAAVAGAVLVAFAGLLLFKFTIERGLIPPGLRVIAGIVTGVGLIGGAQTRRARAYAITADGLAGAGTVILFAAFWAARVLYEFIPVELAFVLMGATTATCVALSVRHDSRVIATIGFVGGFTTPLLLSTGSDNPLGLFGWLLLLDVAFLYLARERGWTWLATLGLLATLGYQASWIVFGMGEDRFGLGVAILVVFAALFAAAGTGLPEEERGPWARTQAAALLLPGIFGLYFALHADLSEHFAGIAGMLLLVSAGAAGVGLQDPRRGTLAAATAVGSLAVAAVWLSGNHGAAADVMKGSALILALAAIHHLGAELDRTPALVGGPRAAGVVAALGGGLVALGALLLGDGDVAPWAALAGVIGAAGFLARQASMAGRAGLAWSVAGLVGLGLGGRLIRNEIGSAFPGEELWIGLMIAATAALLIWSRVRGEKASAHAAAAMPVGLILALAIGPSIPQVAGAVALGGGLVLAGGAAIAATTASAGWWFALAMGVTAKLHTLWGLSASSVDDTGAAVAGGAFGLAAVALFTAWPLATDRFRDARPAWYGAALAAPLFFLPLRVHWGTLADGLDGVPAVVLAGVALAGLAVLQRRWTEDSPVRTSAVVLFASVALLFVAAAVPLQLEKGWVTVAWGLQGAALLWLWRRIDHPGLKYFAAALFALVFVRLCLNPWVLDYAPRGGVRILNWVSWTYLVPAAAMVVGVRLLAPREVERARDWERLSHGAARVAGLIGLAAVAVGFVWINLTVLDWFATGDRLTVDLARLPARDLTISLSWVAYALFLLVLGVVRSSAALRWVGLLLLAATSGKAFLYDLAHLEDLYRVASIVGLGVSLMAVSVLYQRFVAQRPAPDASPETPPDATA